MCSSDLATGVLRTEPSARKRGVLASSDDTRRTRELAAALRPLVDRADALAVEAWSQPRHASAAVKMARAWGVLVTLAGDRPIVEASPQAIKLATAGSKTASKEAVVRAVAFTLSGAGRMLADVPRTLREHAADACGAVLASLRSDVVRMGRRHLTMQEARA